MSDPDDGRGHCPHCGRYCSRIRGYGNGARLVRVTGRCKRHGTVDLTHQPWGWGDFFGAEEPARE